MPKFGESSLKKLATCDKRLQAVANEVVKTFDCTVVYGVRTEAEQNAAVAAGNSKVKWPDSKHNSTPSKAIDLAPFVDGKISWDASQCYYFAGVVMATAAHLGVKLRWGGDWDSDNNVKDQNFNDLVHFEVVD